MGKHVSIITFKNGKIALQRDYGDAARALRQLGISQKRIPFLPLPPKPSTTLKQ
jgi:hypothetical protein